MASGISITNKTLNGDGTMTIEFVYDGTNGAAFGSFFFYGASAGSSSDFNAKFGYSYSVRPTGAYSATFDVPAEIAKGQNVFFACGVALDDNFASFDRADSSFPNGSINQGPAESAEIKVVPDEINLNQTATVTVTATNTAGPTSGRPVSFGYKTGTARGHFVPPTATTDDNGEAVTIFHPDEPGQSHIEATVDQIKVGKKVKVKNA